MGRIWALVGRKGVFVGGMCEESGFRGRDSGFRGWGWGYGAGWAKRRARQVGSWAKSTKFEVKAGPGLGLGWGGAGESLKFGAGAGALGLGLGLGLELGLGLVGELSATLWLRADFAIAILEAPPEGVDLGATLRWRTLNPKPFLLSCRELLCDCAGKEV